MEEHSEHSTHNRTTKRRSSILKQPKSPRQALDELDQNLQQKENSTNKEARLTKRVSFANTCQIQEFIKEHGNSATVSSSTIQDDCHNISQNEAAVSPLSLVHGFLPKEQASVSMLTGEIIYIPLATNTSHNNIELLSSGAVWHWGKKSPQFKEKRKPLSTLNPEQVYKMEHEYDDDCIYQSSVLDVGFISSPLGQNATSSVSDMELTRGSGINCSKCMFGSPEMGLMSNIYKQDNRCGQETIFFTDGKMDLTRVDNCTMCSDTEEPSNLAELEDIESPNRNRIPTYSNVVNNDSDLEVNNSVKLDSNQESMFPNVTETTSNQAVHKVSDGCQKQAEDAVGNSGEEMELTEVENVVISVTTAIQEVVADKYQDLISCHLDGNQNENDQLIIKGKVVESNCVVQDTAVPFVISKINESISSRVGDEELPVVRDPPDVEADEGSVELESMLLVKGILPKCSTFREDNSLHNFSNNNIGDMSSCYCSAIADVTALTRGSTSQISAIEYVIEKHVPQSDVATKDFQEEPQITTCHITCATPVDMSLCMTDPSIMTDAKDDAFLEPGKADLSMNVIKCAKEPSMLDEAIIPAATGGNVAPPDEMSFTRVSSKFVTQDSFQTRFFKGSSANMQLAESTQKSKLLSCSSPKINQQTFVSEPMDTYSKCGAGFVGPGIDIDEIGVRNLEVAYDAPAEINTKQVLEGVTYPDLECSSASLLKTADAICLMDPSESMHFSKTTIGPSVIENASSSQCHGLNMEVVDSSFRPASGMEDLESHISPNEDLHWKNVDAEGRTSEKHFSLDEPNSFPNKKAKFPSQSSEPLESDSKLAICHATTDDATSDNALAPVIGQLHSSSNQITEPMEASVIATDVKILSDNSQPGGCIPTLNMFSVNYDCKKNASVGQDSALLQSPNPVTGQDSQSSSQLPKEWNTKPSSSKTGSLNKNKIISHGDSNDNTVSVTDTLKPILESIQLANEDPSAKTGAQEAAKNDKVSGTVESPQDKLEKSALISRPVCSNSTSVTPLLKQQNNKKRMWQPLFTDRLGLLMKSTLPRKLRRNSTREVLPTSFEIDRVLSSGKGSSAASFVARQQPTLGIEQDRITSLGTLEREKGVTEAPPSCTAGHLDRSTRMAHKDQPQLEHCHPDVNFRTIKPALENQESARSPRVTQLCNTTMTSVKSLHSRLARLVEIVNVQQSERSTSSKTSNVEDQSSTKHSCNKTPCNSSPNKFSPPENRWLRFDEVVRQIEENQKMVAAAEEKVEMLKANVVCATLEIDGLMLRTAALKEKDMKKPPQPSQRFLGYHVKEQSSTTIHLSFWKNILHLKFSLGHLIGENLGATEHLTTENRKILNVEQWSDLKGDSNYNENQPSQSTFLSSNSCCPIWKYAHQSMSAAFKKKDIANRCQTTAELQEMLPDLILLSNQTRMLYSDMKKVSFDHFVVITEHDFSVEFNSLKAFLNFVLSFTLDLATYPDHPLSAHFKLVIGKLSNEEVVGAFKHIEPGPSYLLNIVDAVQNWLEAKGLQDVATTK